MMKIFIVLFSLSSFAGFLPKTFKAQFTQKIISEISGKVKESKGDIDYQYPGRIRFEVTKGGNSIFVSNKKKSWYYTPPFIEGEKGNVVIQNSSTLFLSRFFDTLKKGLTNNKYYNVKKIKNSIVLEFKKDVGESIGIKKAAFASSRRPSEIKSLKELKLMILTRSDGKDIALEFNSFKENVAFAGEHFIFTPPKDTVISEK